MSTFETKIRKLDAVEHHTNADRLALAQIGGYRAVVERGLHKPNDLVLYIQEDSVFTDLTIAQALKIDKYLIGKHKNRVKTIKLRGALSQGIVLPLFQLEKYLEMYAFQKDAALGLIEGADFTDILKLEKYEEPVPIQMRGKVRRWPSFVPHYDIENIKRPESLNQLKEGEEVVTVEKLHGTNITIAIGPGLENDEEAFVCSRNNALKEDSINVYWRATRKYNLIEKVDSIRRNLMEVEYQSVFDISLHGEVIGMQDLKYGYENGEIGFYAFDLRINGQYVDYDKFVAYCEWHDIPIAPLIYRGPYNYDVVNNACQGKTLLGGLHMREGGVTKPVKERVNEHGDRVQFKFISEEYSSRMDGTEYH